VLKFTPDHEWLRVGEYVAIVGITEHAQQQLGELVFVALPPSGKRFAKGAPAAVVERPTKGSSTIQHSSTPIRWGMAGFLN